MACWDELGWWGLPGPCRFVARVASELLASQEGVVGLHLPHPGPDGLLDAIEWQVREESSARPIRVDASRGLRGRSPAHLLATAAEVAPSGIRLVAEFLNAHALADALFVVEGIPAEDWMTWSMFLRALRAERKERLRFSAPCVLVVVPRGVPPDDARAALGGAGIRWMGVVSRTDTQLFAERILGWPGDDLISRLAVSTAVELAGWDPVMVQALAALPPEHRLNPIPALAEHATPYLDLVPSWANGLVDRWDGQAYVHTLSLQAAVNGPALRRRLWQARVREVFPFIERVRHAFIGRYEALLRSKLPITKQFNDRAIIYDDPWRLELFDLHQLLRDSLSRRDATLLFDCYKLRTAMAHGDPGEEARIERASSIWEQAADDIITGCPGWDWARCGQKLVILIGPSGAGKSTYARRHFAQDEIVSSDAIREELFGSRNIGGDQAEVFERVRREVAFRLSSGRRAVVDATNLKAADRLANVRLAPPDMQVEYVLIERSMAEKVAGAGDRKAWVVEAHAAAFAEELPYLLNGDGLPNVRVIVPQGTVLPGKEAA